MNSLPKGCELIEGTASYTLWTKDVFGCMRPTLGLFSTEAFELVRDSELL